MKIGRDGRERKLKQKFMQGTKMWKWRNIIIGAAFVPIVLIDAFFMYRSYQREPESVVKQVEVFNIFATVKDEEAVVKRKLRYMEQMKAKNDTRPTVSDKV